MNYGPRATALFQERRSEAHCVVCDEPLPTNRYKGKVIARIKCRKKECDLKWHSIMFADRKEKKRNAGSNSDIAGHGQAP